MMRRIACTLTLALTLTAAIAVFAQQRAPRGLRVQRSDESVRLKEVLGLNDAQLESIRTLEQTEQMRNRPIVQEIQQKRRELDALLSVSTSNPTEVGNATIALRAAEEKLS